MDEAAEYNRARWRALAERGFRLLRAAEDVSTYPDPAAEPGTWPHFVSVARPWLAFLSRLDPPA